MPVKNFAETESHKLIVHIYARTNVIRLAAVIFNEAMKGLKLILNLKWIFLAGRPPLKEIVNDFADLRVAKVEFLCMDSKIL